MPVLAQVFLQVERHWNAVQCATRATELDPNWADAFLTLGRAQLGIGEVVHVSSAVLLQSCSLEAVRNLIEQCRKSFPVHAARACSAEHGDSIAAQGMCCASMPSHVSLNANCMALSQPEFEEAQSEIAEVRVLVLRHRQQPDAAKQRIQVV